MKAVEIFISKTLIYITYLVTFILPVKKNRISIISYFNNQLGLEFKGLVDILIEEEFEIKKSLNHFKSTRIGKLKYLFSFIYQTYLFNTSRLVILDGNNFVYATIKTKKEVETYQLWHAMGAIKKFGSLTNRRYDIKGYDYLIVSSTYFKEIFAKSLNTEISNIYNLGNIKSDYLFNKDYLLKQKENVYIKYPELKNKKVILYAPTFRGDGIEDMSVDNSNIDLLAKKLSNEYILISKFHPLINTSITSKYSELSLYELINIAEIVISDYSALVYDAMILNKKIILYWYDLEKYQKERGFSIDISKLSLSIALDVYKLYDIIINADVTNDYHNVRNELLENIDGYSLQRISHHIINIVKGDKLDVKK